MILSELATLVSAQHGVFYTMTSPADHTTDAVLEMQAGYGYEERKHLSTTFRMGEGLVGQCAKEKKRILLTDVPGDYVRINSGLGEAAPLNIIVLPVLFEGSLRAVVELASFSPFSLSHQAFLDSITESVGIVLNTIQAAALTEALLKQSQSQAEELRAQQEELRGTNADLASQASLLAEQNVVAEQKNLEVEESNRQIEEKVSQLAVSSKYKSEFIANMSHELRTPLNSLLILAQQLEENPDRNLTDTQVEYASVIHSSGNELLELLNSILDLAKVESGTVAAENEDVSLAELRTGLLREFGPVAVQKGLAYTIDLAPDLPASLVTDPQRLRQILKNLLANAFKFTERGGVQVLIGSRLGPDRRSTSALCLRGQRHWHRHRRRAAARSSRPSPKGTAPPRGCTAAPALASRSAASSSASSAAPSTSRAPRGRAAPSRSSCPSGRPARASPRRRQQPPPLPCRRRSPWPPAHRAGASSRRRTRSWVTGPSTA